MKRVFVFGSNLAGRHGLGAARYALDHYGAEYGVGVGPTGNAYAIPTKNGDIDTLPSELVEEYLLEFLEYAEENSDTIFELTPVGCGLSGKSIYWLVGFLKRNYIPSNVLLSPSFLDHF